MFRAYNSSRTNIIKYKENFFNTTRKFSNHLESNLKLPNLNSKLFSNHQDIKQLQTKLDIHKRITTEFDRNPFAQKILTGTEHLISNGKLDIYQSKSIAEDKAAYDKNRAVFYFDTEKKFIHVPSCIESPFSLMSVLNTSNNFQRGKVDYFVGALIHECTHAVDDLLADLAATKKDKRLISLDEWLRDGLDFDYYEREEMRDLCIALRKDKASLEKLTQMSDTTAKEILYFINLIDQSIWKTNYLDEMKSYFVQMTTTGAFSSELIKKYLPETSKWFFEKFVPRMESKIIEYDHLPSIKK